MALKRPPRPTDGELEILRVLWNRGPSTVREVHERIRARRRTAYTTTLKMMQLMAEKGILSRDDSSRTHVYSTAVEESDTQKRLVNDLLQKAFAGSARKLMAALTANGLSPKELDEIRELLAGLQEEGQ